MSQRRGLFCRCCFFFFFSLLLPDCLQLRVDNCAQRQREGERGEWEREGEGEGERDRERHTHFHGPRPMALSLALEQFAPLLLPSCSCSLSCEISRQRPLAVVGVVGGGRGRLWSNVASRGARCNSASLHLCICICHL